MNDKTKYTCALCGHKFTMDEGSCPSACPFSRNCNLVCCPNCGYSFPKNSRTVDFFKKIIKKRRNHELRS